MNYMTWKKLLDNRIQIMPLELAGRGRRINEPLYNSTEEAINDIYNVIYKELDGTPYAIFGHSMGTMLTYELLRKITAKMHQEPVHVFFSGRYPPYIDAEDKFTHLLPDEEFLAEIFELGGMDQEVLQCQELISIFLPVLRSDYKLVETYKHQGDIAKINCDITILTGKRDSYVTRSGMLQWQELTTGSYEFYEFDAGHFFINKFKEDVVDIVNKSLSRY